MQEATQVSLLVLLGAQARPPGLALVPAVLLGQGGREEPCSQDSHSGSTMGGSFALILQHRLFHND